MGAESEDSEEQAPGSRFGAVGFPIVFHVGPKAGKGVCDGRASSETCEIKSLEGSAIIFPTESRGKSSAPT